MKNKSILYLAFQNWLQSIEREIRFVSLFYILTNLVSEIHEDVQQSEFFLQLDKRNLKLAHIDKLKPRDANWLQAST